MGLASLHLRNEVAGSEGREMKANVSIEQVERYWSANPSGADQSDARDRREYFKDIEIKRYAVESHILEEGRFGGFRGKKVLEIGAGVGTDGAQFARNGAVYTGINIDSGSVDLARERFSVEGLQGTILQMNAERLEFPDAVFDHVYSFGVIHHSPSTEQIVHEMCRVLKPGGTVTVMVYNRSSINYWFEIMFLRKIFRLVLLFPGSPGFLSRVIGLDEEKLRRHREIVLSESMTHERWVSINTDGPDCPLAKVYGAGEARRLFSSAGFEEIETFRRYFQTDHYGYFGRWIPRPIAQTLGRLGGWHRYIRAVKPVRIR
jgi:2-polyprenyl-3-methyl-5-hydroxy-6-metoxy-1,4-benzoquinol methylase